jgi:transcriptional regulator with PAS, ATPase and Fis domain
MLRGESGSGKELVAKAIHDYSQRKNKIFVAINCAALNSNILADEHRKLSNCHSLNN